MRVSLADRKEWRTKTTGFGPEWRSNTCGEEGGRKAVSKTLKQEQQKDNSTEQTGQIKTGMLRYNGPLLIGYLL